MLVFLLPVGAASLHLARVGTFLGAFGCVAAVSFGAAVGGSALWPVGHVAGVSGPPVLSGTSLALSEPFVGRLCFVGKAATCLVPLVPSVYA